MKFDKKAIVWGIFIGSIWGVLEATLGYVLNMLPFGLSGAIMFPIGFALMRYAYSKSGSTQTLIIVPIVTALIKLTNLTLTFLPTVKVVNPALAILLEGLAIAIVLNKNFVPNFKQIMLMSLSWRVVYLIEVTVLYYINIPSRMIQGGFWSIAEFLIYAPINALIIFGIVKLSRPNEKKVNLSPLVAGLVLVLAVTVQYFIRKI